MPLQHHPCLTATHRFSGSTRLQSLPEGVHDTDEIVLTTVCKEMQVDVNRVWLTFSSFLVAFVFVFGNNIRNIYESIIFLFVVHPFDVGDVLLLEDKNWCAFHNTTRRTSPVP